MKTPLPPILEEKLSDFRSRVWMVKLAEGLLAALVALALSYLLVFGLDRFFETPAWLRLAILLGGMAVLGLGLPLKWHRWVWRQRRLEDAARLLRRKFPRLGDQLLGIVELSRMESGLGGRSETLVKAAMTQAAEAVKHEDFRKAVPDARHRSLGWAVSCLLALVGVGLALTPEATRNAWERWLTPWRPVERFTFARVEDLPAQLVVPYAEPFELRVRLAADTRWSPARGSARLAGEPGVEAPLQERDYTFAFQPQKKDGPLDLALGDVRRTIQVQPRVRPELSSMNVHLRLPAYLEYQHEPVLEVRGGSISLLRGAQAAFEATATRELAEAQMDGQPQKVESDHWRTVYQPVEKNGEHRFSWRDGSGLTPREPLVMKIQAVEDEAPRITARRETQEQVVLDSEVITFALSVQDDFGIKQAGLSWRSLMPSDGKTPTVKGEKLAAAGGPEKRELELPATFCATREGVAPQTLEIRAWADDYLPGRAHSESAAFVIHVLNKTDHALWLTEQFGTWLHSARESYEREQQLHQTNKELRALSTAELDRPENRRRVAQQAAAENANGDRLTGLTQAGRQLVEQATRNPEFDAARLESWATMLKSLQDIAANRMPSVADLLKQTGSAPMKPLQASANENKTSPGAPPNPGQQANASQKPSAAPSVSAPNVSHGELPPGVPGEAKPIDPNAAPKAPAPSIADRENGFGKPPEAPKEDPNAKPKPPGSGKLTLPTTTLGAVSVAKTEEPKPPESPAQEKMQQAVTEQKDLLAEFAKVSDQLADILSSLESSTFVKRLKAASRQQMTIAGDLKEKTLDAFGLSKSEAPPDPAKQVGLIAAHETEQSEKVRVIQADLEAFYERKPDLHFRNIIDQMKKTEVVKALAVVGERTADNLSGRSISGSEYWADTLDRWAEEMVKAGQCSSCSSCSSDSLPPEIVLKVMKSLRDEMKLRDETRELENSRPALEVPKFEAMTQGLAGKQEDVGKNTQEAADDISALPKGDERFSKELKLLAAVTNAMADAYKTLSDHDTGPQAVAAETEAIELLLQARRQKPNSGGGGGSSPGGGGRAERASSAALAEIGPGADASPQAAVRRVGQATGHAGREFPEEFRAGLDEYFNALEGKGASR